MPAFPRSLQGRPGSRARIALSVCLLMEMCEVTVSVAATGLGFNRRRDHRSTVELCLSVPVVVVVVPSMGLGCLVVLLGQTQTHAQRVTC